jgi:hypothetical protein
MSLSKIFKNLTHGIVYVFFILIVGYFVLNFIAGKFSGNILGQSATWVEQHSQPGY